MTIEKAKDEMLAKSVQQKNGLKTVLLRKIYIFINKIFNEHKAQLKAERKKARSIVAMLFWESQRARRICGKNNGVYTTIRGQFDRAYAMLKDNK